MWKVMSRNLRRNSWKRSTTLSRSQDQEGDFSYFRRIISELSSISLVKRCSDQREILSDETDKIWCSKSIENDVAERENRVNSSDTVYLGMR